MITLNRKKFIANVGDLQLSIAENTENLKEIIIEALEDLKAINIVVIPVAHLTTITDYMVICSGTSARHIKAIANNVITNINKAGFSESLEGEEDSEWLLIDANDVIVHIMLPKTRDFYNLEGLWQTDEKT